MSLNFICVAGLPRSGSTLLCQLLASHPEIYCEGHSSPVCNSLLQIRRSISDDQFFLSQLDTQFEITYQHLKKAMSGFMTGWYEGITEPLVVDKNRAWLHCAELLIDLFPHAKLIVPVRELGQVYGSIESQHQKTLLIDFIDHLADYDRLGRADQLFAQDKAIGSALSSIRAVEDLPQSVKDHIYFLRFEDLTSNPDAAMNKLWDWLGLKQIPMSLSTLQTRPHESDSHYRFKYVHRQNSEFSPPKQHVIPPRIQAHIESACTWFYQWFYPDHLKR